MAIAGAPEAFRIEHRIDNRWTVAEAQILQGDDDTWLVSWMVRQSGREKSKGCRIFSRQDMREAFGIDPVGSRSKLAVMNGADVIVQGKFVRLGNYLNIPCPGTGHDGDPNVSIEIYAGIREAVRTLLG